MSKGYPDNNPKTVQGVKKLPLHLVPPAVTHYLAMAFADGAQKYGPYNWREKNISSSVYVAAAKRHIDAWWDGEEVAKDSGVHHLAHAAACLAMILDTKDSGMLHDDRPPPGQAAAIQLMWGALCAQKQSNSSSTSKTPTTGRTRSSPAAAAGRRTSRSSTSKASRTPASAARTASRSSTRR